jgi:hypothetical protein
MKEKASVPADELEEPDMKMRKQHRYFCCLHSAAFRYFMNEMREKEKFEASREAVQSFALATGRTNPVWTYRQKRQPNRWPEKINVEHIPEGLLESSF